MENVESMWTKFVLVDNGSNRKIGRDTIGRGSGDESDSDASLATHDSMPALRSASESDVDDDLFQKSCLESEVGDDLLQNAP